MNLKNNSEWIYKAKKPMRPTVENVTMPERSDSEQIPLPTQSVSRTHISLNEFNDVRNQILDTGQSSSQSESSLNLKKEIQCIQ